MREMLNKIKKNKTTAIIYTFTLVLLAFIVISVTYAYFEAQSLAAGISNVNAEFSTLDEYLITTNGNLNLVVTPTTLPENGNNQEVTATAQVSLKRNPDTTNTATRTYYIYLNIQRNTFTRTNPLKPEIILNAYLNNQEVTIQGLTQVTKGSVTGYDITEESGLIPIVEEQSISSSSSDTATLHNWTFKITYLNLDTDQSENIGANLDSNIWISKDEHSGFTGTLYRFNTRTAFNNHPIEDETNNVWCQLYEGVPDCTYPYVTQELCEERGSTCSQETATLGVGNYETEADKIRHSLVYCGYNSDEDLNSCNFGYTFDTQTECEDYLTTNNISGYTCIENTVIRYVYLKHEVLDDIIVNSEICLWANNHEFCIAPNYWVETGNGGNNHQSEENGIATKNKLDSDFFASLGVQASSYYVDSSSITYSIGPISIYIYSSGTVEIANLSSNQGCEIQGDGASHCR